MNEFLIGPATFALDVIGVLDTLPCASGASALDGYIAAPGSSSLNLAYGLRQLGHSVGIFGSYANDAQGAVCRADLEMTGINVALMRPTRKSTYTAFVLAESGVPRRTIFADSAAPRDASESWDGVFSLVPDTRYYGVLAPLVDTPVAAALYEGLFRSAKQAGFITFLEPCEDERRLNPELLFRLMRWVDIFLPGIKELRHVTAIDSPDAAAKVALDAGARVAAVKLGSEGCLVLTRGERARAAGYSVPVLDKTGAGDAFAAGFLHGCANGWTLERCAEFANAYAASNIMRLGPRAGMADEYRVRREVIERRWPVSSM